MIEIPLGISKVRWAKLECNDDQIFKIVKEISFSFGKTYVAEATSHQIQLHFLVLEL